MIVARNITPALLLAGLSTQIVAQELKPWKHGVIEPKGDAGFMRTNEDLNHTVRNDASLRARRQQQMSNEIANFSGEVEATLAQLGRISAAILRRNAP